LRVKHPDSSQKPLNFFLGTAQGISSPTEKQIFRRRLPIGRL
jgi:hypothetical protein